MKKSFIMVLFLMIIYGCAFFMVQLKDAGTTLAASINDQNEYLVKGKELFAQGRTIFFSGKGDFDEAINALTASKEFFTKLGDDFENYYWRGEAEFVLAEIFEVNNDKRKAAQSFSESSKLSEKALIYNDKSSDGNRLVADTYMRLMNYNGTIYAMSHSSKTFKLLNKALSINKNNYPVYNSLAMCYFYTPTFAGGSIEKTIRSLEKALESKDQYTNFISYMWLGIVYDKKKDKAKAINYFTKALEIYPESPWAKEYMKKIKSSN
jgi:tetratricopeptide (TPR) repeat protein